ncbi:hypothetical protein D3227_26465 [Mesorhizobium waimense]|uniref:Sulfotransferase family protein n=1 Tax=Mesorhizobium waimense TaxID=1300307 RepID=A0A3A5KJI4_9HYPH|nr:sulfotransferase family protein [Mesorhizobium waimense]RJT32724.1 hypothetical protein D3227_26465 [Mesorhizobium waimense]
MTNQGVPKIFGVGLAKTGTKTLGTVLRGVGFNHAPHLGDVVKAWHKKEYGKIFDFIGQYDSFEDWPYPLMCSMLIERFPDARFILTRRSSPERWLSSLKKHTLTSNPFKNIPSKNVRKVVWGQRYPFGQDARLIQFYTEHNARVRRMLSGKPFLELCWDEGDGVEKLAEFLGVDVPAGTVLPKVNASADRDRTYVLANRLLASAFAPAAWADIWRLKL